MYSDRFRIVNCSKKSHPIKRTKQKKNMVFIAIAIEWEILVFKFKINDKFTLGDTIQTIELHESSQ